MSRSSNRSAVLGAAPELLTLREAAHLGFGGYSTLRKRIADGELAALRVGAVYRVRRADLEALAAPAGTDPIDAAIERLVAAAPPLSSDQRARLAILAGGAA